MDDFIETSKWGGEHFPCLAVHGGISGGKNSGKEIKEYLPGI